MTTQIISADSHVQEPEEIYSERLPRKFRDRVPHVEERDGKRFFIVEGRKPRRLDVAEGRETEEDQEREFRSDPAVAATSTAGCATSIGTAWMPR